MTPDNLPAPRPRRELGRATHELARRGLDALTPSTPTLLVHGPSVLARVLEQNDFLREQTRGLAFQPSRDLDETLDALLRPDVEQLLVCIDEHDTDAACELVATLAARARGRIPVLVESGTPHDLMRVNRHGGDVFVCRSAMPAGSFGLAESLADLRALRRMLRGGLALRPEVAGRWAARLAAKPQVLIIDDEPMCREVHEVYLGQLGYRILTAGNGAEGRALMREHADTLELVLCNEQMPRESGLEMLQQLGGAPRATPIAHYSGGCPQETAELAWSYGAWVSGDIILPLDQVRDLVARGVALSRARHLASLERGLGA